MEDDDWEGDSEDDDEDERIFVDVEEEAGAIGAAAMDAAQYAQLCQEYEAAFAESEIHISI